MAQWTMVQQHTLIWSTAAPLCHLPPTGRRRDGRDLYRSGNPRLQNTLTDFAACGDQLVADGWTTPERRPCKAEVPGACSWEPSSTSVRISPPSVPAPFVDVVTTMLDESIPLTAGSGGMGSENENFDTMLAYPYDNVTAQTIPSCWSQRAFTIPAQYWEPAKWVAKLSHENGDHPLRKTNMGAGQADSWVDTAPLKTWPAYLGSGRLGPRRGS